MLKNNKLNLTTAFFYLGLWNEKKVIKVLKKKNVFMCLIRHWFQRPYMRSGNTKTMKQASLAFQVVLQSELPEF